MADEPDNQKVEFCPHCGQFKLKPENIDPSISTNTFALIKEASIRANQKKQVGVMPAEDYLIAPADTLAIREYFDGMMAMAEAVLIPEDFDNLKRKLSEARLKSGKSSLQRLFRYKQGEALRYVDFMREEMEIQEENYAHEYQKMSPEIKPKMTKVLSIIRELSRDGDSMISVPLSEILRKCQAEGLKLGDIMRSIDFLKQEGDIFEPMRDRIQLI